MIAAFWGPVPGQAGTSSHAAAVAAMLALDYQLRVLVTQTQQGPSLLETSDSSRGAESFLDGRGGMDAVERLVNCGMLTPEGLRDNTDSVILGRLDLLQGPATCDEESLEKALPLLAEAAKRHYDLTLIDVGSGKDNRLTRTVLELADLIVVSLNQNVSVLEPFFGKREWPSALQSKPHLYLLGRYDRHSRYSVKKISGMYRVPAKQLFAIPYNSKFLDAQNDRRVVEYLLRATQAKQGFLEYNEEVSFISSLREAGDNLLKQLALSPRAEVGV